MLEGLIMYHNYEVGNIVRLKSNGQEMQITSVCRNPFDGELSGYIVCEWEEDGRQFKRTFHIDEVEFVNMGNVKPYDADSNSYFSWW